MANSSSSSKYPKADVARLIGEVRGGSPLAIGKLLSAFRPYLLAIAAQSLDATLAGKVSASDIVQEASLRAHNGFPGFRGITEAEFRAWLLSILKRCLADEQRRFQRSKKRRVHHERSLSELESKLLLDRIAVREGDSARRLAERKDAAAQAQRALATLAPNDRELIEWRSRDNLPFREIGERTNRTEDAARMAWTRAIRRLRKILDEILDEPL